MFNQEIFAVSVGRAVALLRASPPDPAQQIAALEAVQSLISLDSASLRVYDGSLSIDNVGIAPDMPTVPELVRRIQEHGLVEITIARGAPPYDLLVLLRTLAGEPERLFDATTVKQRLGKAAAASIVVLPLKALEAASGRRAASVSEAFELYAREEAAAAGPGTLPDRPAAAAPRARESQGGAPQARPSQGGAPEAGREDWAALSGVPFDTPLGAALQAVTLDPYGEQILDRLSVLGRAISKAFGDDQVALAAQALAAVLRLEPGAPDGTPRSSYVITLRRTLTRETLAQLAQFAPDARLGPLVSVLLQRGGADAVEILLEHLSTAPNIRARKAFMTVLRGMRSGTERALEMLYHDEWFVVRNVAELVGELQMEEAVPRLSELLGHADTRVNRAAAIALAKIGTVATVEPLLRVLREGVPEMRALVASNIGGPQARALAMPLVTLAAGESEPVVLAEYYRALGRIGTPDSLQALAKAAQSAGSLLRRRPAAVRVAAIEGLRYAGGSLALRTLEALTKDSDKVVRAAAEKALAAAPK